MTASNGYFIKLREGYIRNLGSSPDIPHCIDLVNAKLDIPITTYNTDF